MTYAFHSYTDAFSIIYDRRCVTAIGFMQLINRPA